MALTKINVPSSVGIPDWHAMGFEDYKQWVSKTFVECRKPIYRGQKRDWPLLPRVIGDNPRGTILNNERRLLDEFKKKAPRCLQVPPTNDYDWLAVAQQHGLPTRLLDWTYDAYVALWFAFGKPERNDSHPEVWMFSTSEDEDIPSLEDARPFSGNRTKVFKPTFEIPRMRAQKGCFVLFKYIEKSYKGFVALEDNVRLRKHLTRVRIAEHSRNEILQELANMGYTRDLLFPNIDEVAKQVKDSILGGNP